MRHKRQQTAEARALLREVVASGSSLSLAQFKKCARFIERSNKQIKEVRKLRDYISSSEFLGGF